MYPSHQETKQLIESVQARNDLIRPFKIWMKN